MSASASQHEAHASTPTPGSEDWLRQRTVPELVQQGQSLANESDMRSGFLTLQIHEFVGNLVRDSQSKPEPPPQVCGQL